MIEKLDTFWFGSRAAACFDSGAVGAETDKP